MCRSFDRCFSRPASDISEPRINHFVALLDPALIRNGSGVGMSRGGPDIFNGNARDLADSGANLIGALIGQNLNIEIENDGSCDLIRKRQRGDPKVHVDALRLLMLLCAPTAMGNIWRRI